MRLDSWPVGNEKEFENELLIAGWLGWRVVSTFRNLAFLINLLLSTDFPFFFFFIIYQRHRFKQNDTAVEMIIRMVFDTKFCDIVQI